MSWAEDITIREHKNRKIAVISGVGTRKYYRNLGYELEGPYMVKSLEEGVYKNALDYYWGRGPSLQLTYNKERSNLIEWPPKPDDAEDEEWFEEYDRKLVERVTEKKNSKILDIDVLTKYGY